MDTVKARKQGNAVMITLASKFNVAEGQIFYISKEEDGTISLIPKIEDYFADAVEGQFIDEEDELAVNFTTKSSELDE